MRVVTHLLFAAIVSVVPYLANAQNYHKEDSLLFNWMKRLESQSPFPATQVQKMEQDSMNTIMTQRKTTQWNYAGSDKVFFLHKQQVLHGVANNNTPAVMSWEACDTCPTPHDSAWISQQKERVKNKNKEAEKR